MAGLSEKRAAAIFSQAKTQGFTTRAEVAKVKGIGRKTYQQCVGFLRVTRASTDDPWLRLESTRIHPDDYDLTRALLKTIGASHSILCTPDMQPKVLHWLGVDDFDPDKMLTDDESMREVASLPAVVAFCRENNFSAPSVVLALAESCRSSNFDYRIAFSQPLFRKEVLTIGNLSVGTVVTGRVSNVVTFGAFVDIGCGHDGLLHGNALRAAGSPALRAGDVVTVRVVSVDVRQHRIGLDLRLGALPRDGGQCTAQDSDRTSKPATARQARDGGRATGRDDGDSHRKLQAPKHHRKSSQGNTSTSAGARPRKRAAGGDGGDRKGSDRHKKRREASHEASHAPKPERHRQQNTKAKPTH